MLGKTLFYKVDVCIRLIDLIDRNDDLNAGCLCTLTNALPRQQTDPDKHGDSNGCPIGHDYSAAVRHSIPIGPAEHKSFDPYAADFSEYRHQHPIHRDFPAVFLLHDLIVI